MNKVNMVKINRLIRPTTLDHDVLSNHRPYRNRADIVAYCNVYIPPTEKVKILG